MQKTAKQKMALVSPNHHSTTQTGVAEQWVAKKTIAIGVCFVGLLLLLGLLLLWGLFCGLCFSFWCVRCGVVVVVVCCCCCCCFIGCVLVVGLVVGLVVVVVVWCGSGVVWCWGGVVWCWGGVGVVWCWGGGPKE